jgi:hypothetical protein
MRDEEIHNCVQRLIVNAQFSLYVRQRLTPFTRLEESSEETFDRLLNELVSSHPSYFGWDLGKDRWTPKR